MEDKSEKEDIEVEDLGDGDYRIKITKENLVAAYESVRRKRRTTDECSDD